MLVGLLVIYNNSSSKVKYCFNIRFEGLQGNVCISKACIEGQYQRDLTETI